MSVEAEPTIADRVTEIPAAGGQRRTPELQAEATPPVAAPNDTDDNKSTAEATKPTIKEVVLQDARSRAELQGLTGPAVDIKVRLELAFREALEEPEGEDASVILLATIIAGKVETCLDSRSANAVATSTINEMGRLRPVIIKNAEALKAAAAQVLLGT